MDTNFHRKHFLNEAEHSAVNRYVQITAAYLNLFLKGGEEILDVGGADGIMQDFLNGKVKSIDIFPASKRVVEGTIFGENDDYYDMIIYNHVLEHIWKFYEEIEAASRKVKNGGFLFIACPCSDMQWAYEYKSHVVLFNETILRRLVEHHGFEVVEYSKHCFREDKVEQWLIAKKQ